MIYHDYGDGVSNRAPLGVRQDIDGAKRRMDSSERSERIERSGTESSLRERSE
jgi:hypothetical protein